MCLTLVTSKRQRRKFNKGDFSMELFPLPSAPQGTDEWQSLVYIISDKSMVLSERN